MDSYYPRLRNLREDHDLSQQQIATYLNMKQPQYSRYERGLRDIPTDVLIRLARLYGTTTDYILGLALYRIKLPRPGSFGFTTKEAIST